MKHVFTRGIVLVLVSLGLVSGCGVSGISGSERSDSSTSNLLPNSLTLGLTYIPNVQFAPFYLAKSRGLFQVRDRQLSVELRHHGADEGLFNSLLTNKEQAVVAFGDEAVQASSQGMKLSIIGVLYQKYPVVVIAKPDSGIRTWDDLKGKTVGVPGKYGSNWFGFLYGLNKVGLSLDDVKVAEIGYTQQAQLTTNKVDAVVGFSNNDLVRFQLAGTEVVSVSLPEDTPLIGAAIVTTQEFARDNPLACQALVNGMASAVRQITADPKEAISAAKHYDQTLEDPVSLKAAEAVALATNDLIALPQYYPGEPGRACAPDLEKFAAMIDNLGEIGVLGTAQDLSALNSSELELLARPWNAGL